MAVSEQDREFLRRCVDLAAQALDSGDEPFGSLLVLEGRVRFEDHNHVAGGDPTRHPEIAAATWAIDHLDPRQRAASTVYTSGEHCAMCAAAHGWAGLGRIVLATTSAQLGEWLAQWGVPEGPVAPLPIQTVVPGAVVDGPEPSLADEVADLHRRYHRVRSAEDSHDR